MNGYIIPDDNKLHTHLSELMRCTPAQMHSVLNERAGISKPYSSPGLDFGSSRHDDWEKEAKKTGRSPECFKKASAFFDITAEIAEREFASEIIPGVVLHSRIDLYGDKILADYKTTTMSYTKAQQLYNRSIQLKIYAYQLMIHDISVEKMVYLIEHWDREHTKILSYSKLEKDYLPRYIKEAKSWLERRVKMLQKGITIAKEDGIL